MTEIDKLQLEVFRLETMEELSEEGKKIILSMRDYCQRKYGSLRKTIRLIKAREAYIADLEEHLLERVYREKKIKENIVFLGELGKPVTEKIYRVIEENL